MKAIIFNDDKGLVNYVIEDIPAEYKEKANEYRHVLIEALCDFDDNVMESFLDGPCRDFESY